MQSVVDERIRMELSGDDTGTKTPKYSEVVGGTCLIVTLSTTNRAWNGLVQDPALSSERPVSQVPDSWHCFFCVVSLNGFKVVLQINTCDCVGKKLC